MATGQKLRGFVGQGMSGLRKAKSPLSYVYSPGSYTLNITKPGWYRFVLWGPGGRIAFLALGSGCRLLLALATMRRTSTAQSRFLMGRYSRRAGVRKAQRRLVA